MIQEWLFDAGAGYFALAVEHSATCIGILNLAFGRVWLILRLGLLCLDMLSEWHFIGLEACLRLAICIGWLPLRVDPRRSLLSAVAARPLTRMMVQCRLLLLRSGCSLTRVRLSRARDESVVQLTASLLLLAARMIVSLQE